MYKHIAYEARFKHLNEKNYSGLVETMEINISELFIVISSFNVIIYACRIIIPNVFDI